MDIHRVKQNHTEKSAEGQAPTGLRKNPRYAALKLLNYRARSTEEMRERLMEKGFSEAETNAVVDEFCEKGILDDEKMANDICDSFVRNKLAGKRVLSLKLKKRMIPERIAAEAMNRHLTHAVELMIAKKALAKRKEGEEYAKSARHLAARGFSSPVIGEAMSSRGGTGDGW